MRITKQITEQVVTFLLKDKIKEIVELEVSLKEFIEEKYLQSISKEVLVFYHTKGIGSFINTSSRLALMGNGFNHEHVSTKNSVPVDNQGYFYYPDVESADLIRKKINQVSDKRKERNLLTVDLHKIIHFLGTNKKIIEEFPETSSILSANSNTCVQLSLNIQGIKDRLVS